jgi:hypothetical protein
MKFKNDIEVQAGIKDSSGSDGTLGQVLSSTVSGVSWINPPVGVTGSGTTNYLPKWSSSTGLTNSIIFNNGNGVSIGATSSSATSGWRVNIHPDISQAGLGIFCYNNNSLHGLRIEMTGTGDFIQARDVATQSDVFFVDYLGNATANSFIKTGGTSSQYLMADGSVSTGPSVSGYVPYTGANQNLDLGSNNLLARNLIINHPSGSGVAASITKGGSGEALTVLKTSGSGNAASILGGVTLLEELHLNTDLADAYISSASTWNAKIGGSGTVNRVPRFTGTSTIADGSMIDNGTFVLVGGPTNTGNITFQVNGNARIANELWLGSTINNGTNIYTLPGSTGTLALTSQLHNPVTIGTPANGLSLAGQVLSLAVATATQNGALSSTDWTTFNSKQGALNGTGFVKVSGTTVTYDNSVYALDNTVVKLTGNQTITGEKSFNNNTQLAGLRANNTNIGYGLYVDNSSLGIGAYVSNSGGGRGFFSQNAANSQGSLYVAKNDLGSFGELFIGLYDNVTKFLVDHNGNLTGNSFIKSGGTSAQILAADGSVITAGTGISISGGTISSTVVGGVTSFNTRTGAVTLTSTDVNTALGYTAANDANVVKLTGDQNIGGIKSFTLNNGAGDNFTFRINYFTSSGGITSAITPLEVINNNSPSTPFFKLDNGGNITANSFVKIGGNSTQYLKADGSVSTAMNSRIEVNFTATSGQTTFTTPYEVGQIDVYYNGSKLNPSEFTATNGTTVVLSQAATLNAQISIVKYVGSINGSSGTTNRVAKFTGTVTLGDSQITDNGTNVGIGTTSPSVQFNVGHASHGVGIAYLATSSLPSTAGFFTDSGINGGQGFGSLQIKSRTDFSGYSINFFTALTANVPVERMRIASNGNVGIGTTSPNTKLQVSDASVSIKATSTSSTGFSSSAFALEAHNGTSVAINGSLFLTNSTFLYGTISPNQVNLYGTAGNGVRLVTNLAPIIFSTGNADADFSPERMRIASNGNIGIGTSSPDSYLAGTIGTVVYHSTSPARSLANNSGYWLNYLVGTEYRFFNAVNGAVHTIFQNGNYSFSGTNVSDIRLKKDIQELNVNYTEKVTSLKPKSYFMKDNKNRKHYGFIAQEVYKTIPDLISGDINGEEYLGVDYNGIITLLVGSIKELTARLEILENK